MPHSLRHGESRGSGDGHRRRPTGEQEQAACSRLIDRRQPVVRPTDTYGERPRGTLQRLVVKGVLLAVTTGVIGALAGWTRQVDAVDQVAAPDAGLVAREMGSMADQLES